MSTLGLHQFVYLVHSLQRTLHRQGPKRAHRSVVDLPAGASFELSHELLHSVSLLLRSNVHKFRALVTRAAIQRNVLLLLQTFGADRCMREHGLQCARDGLRREASCAVGPAPFLCPDVSVGLRRVVCARCLVLLEETVQGPHLRVEATLQWCCLQPERCGACGIRWSCLLTWPCSCASCPVPRSSSHRRGKVRRLFDVVGGIARLFQGDAVTFQNSSVVPNLPHEIAPLGVPRSAQLRGLYLQLVDSILHVAHLFRLGSKLPFMLCPQLGQERRVSALAITIPVVGSVASRSHRALETRDKKTCGATWDELRCIGFPIPLLVVCS
mmetsp:Transcript_5149/g.14436  ORF Transcript_5149/g.14436 Transcript_5149/m.14436 type:complete len:326 (+) Transcript_5149:1232-2209(+)